MSEHRGAEWVVVAEGDEGGEQGYTSQVVADGFTSEAEALADVQRVASNLGRDAMDTPYNVTVLTREQAAEAGIE